MHNCNEVKIGINIQDTELYEKEVQAHKDTQKEISYKSEEKKIEKSWKFSFSFQSDKKNQLPIWQLGKRNQGKEE